MSTHRDLEITAARQQYADTNGRVAVEVRSSGQALGTIRRRISPNGRVSIRGRMVPVHEIGGAAYVQLPRNALPDDLDPRGY
jgi:hypothetical protein